MMGRGRVTLLSRVPFEPEEVDRYYGTSLCGHPIENIVVQSPILEWLAAKGVPVALARFHHVMAAGKRRAGEFHLTCSACNELDLGVPAIDYVHYPWNAYPRPDAPPQWGENPVLRRILMLYNWGCCRISGFSSNRCHNLTLANSTWTRELYARVYPDKPCFVLNPPALAPVLEDAPENRKERFLSIGRVAASKEWEKLIDIVEALRRRGHEVGLTLAGSRDDPHYENLVRQRAEKAGEWVELRLDQTREQLQNLLRTHRYGLHGMVDEHFGMAVSELMLGGCLTVVPNSGGQVEIVADERLRYDHPTDAVEKIDRFLSSSQLQDELWQGQKEHRKRFTREAFQHSFEEIVDNCLEQGVEAVIQSKLRET